MIPLIPVYVILHELLHGIVYLILTDQRFKIGRNCYQKSKLSVYVLSFLLAFHFFTCRSDIYLMKEFFKIKDARKLLISEDKNGDNVV